MMICLLTIIFAGFSFSVQAQVPDDIYLEQQQGNSCTLCSAAMMIRKFLWLSRCADWECATETAVGEQAWTSAGLSWQWDYSMTEGTLTVEHIPVEGITGADLWKLLAAHPEGLLLYCGGNNPHGVLLTDYIDTTFYCADPAAGYSGREIPLAESLLGDRHGMQESILNHVTALWLITDSSIPFPICEEKELPLLFSGGGEIAAVRI